MPADRHDQRTARARIASGPSATRSLWLTAAGTGVGTALVASVTAVAAVAVVWLPASGGSGSATSAIRSGLLTFLAALHGGITVDGVPATFVPLGLTVLVGVFAWRAGATLAEAADDLGEQDPARLGLAAGLQAVAFAISCAVLAATATLGTSRVSLLGAGLGGLALFAIAGGIPFVRRTALADALAAAAPAWAAPTARIAAAAVAVYLAAGALLVAGALVVHHDRVIALSGEVGGGWSGVPILLLGILAAPNAVIAGAGYLSGSGFAVGSGTTIGLDSTAHGRVPAFPILGALPDGDGATLPVWLLAIGTPVLAGCVVAALARRADGGAERWRAGALGVLGAGVAGAVLAWQAGGAIGGGRLHTVGASPWQFGTALAAAVGVVAAIVHAAAAAGEMLGARADAETGPLRATLSAVKAAVTADDVDDRDDVGDRDASDDSDAGSGKKLAG